MNERVKKIDELMLRLDKKDEINEADRIEIKDFLILYRRRLIADELEEQIMAYSDDENSLDSIAKEAKEASKNLRRKR